MSRIGSTFVVLALLCVYPSGVNAQWVQTNGPGGGYTNCFATGSTDLFAGIYGGGVWGRPLSEMITSVEQIPDQLPEAYVLNQNSRIRLTPAPQSPSRFHTRVTSHLISSTHSARKFRRWSRMILLPVTIRQRGMRQVSEAASIFIALPQGSLKIRSKWY